MVKLKVKLSYAGLFHGALKTVELSTHILAFQLVFSAAKREKWHLSIILRTALRVKHAGHREGFLGHGKCLKTVVNLRSSRTKYKNEWMNGQTNQQLTGLIALSREH